MKIVLFTIAALLATINIQAQKDSLNAVIQVENDYNPTFSKATKQIFTPQIELPTDNTPLDLVFSQSASPFKQFTSSRNLGGVLPVQQSTYKGYSRLGYGNNNNLDAKIGYKIENNKDLTFNFLGSLTGFKTPLKAIESQRENWDARFYNTWIVADMTYLTEKLEMQILGGFHNNVFNYQSSVFPTLGITDKQNSDEYRLELKLKSNDSQTSDFAYTVDAGYQFNTQKYALGLKNRVGEHNFKAGTELSYFYNDIRTRKIGIDIDLDGFSYTGTEAGFGYKYKSYLSIQLNPYIGFKIDNWNLRLGLHADMVTANGRFIQFSPDFTLDGLLSNNLTLYVKAIGGRKLNTFGTLNEESPYWSPNMNEDRQYTSTHTLIDAQGGIKLKFEPVQIHLFTGYEFSTDKMLPFTAQFVDNGLFYTQFTQSRTRDYYIGAGVSYDYSGWLNVSGEARYDNWNCSGSGEKLLFMPMANVDIRTRARLYEGLYFGLGYEFTRYTKSDGGRIANVNNFKATASYRFLKQFQVYIQGENLFNSKYLCYPGYYAQGTYFLAGLEYSF